MFVKLNSGDIVECKKTKDIVECGLTFIKLDQVDP